MPVSIHEHPEEWLAAALADGLSPEERRSLDEHLAGCERCRELQADFAALDETLLRDFPAAVGPGSGFETRLVAGFRRRRGRGWQWAKLRTLAGWLVRQRGVRFAGVAASLLGLVWLGQTLTGGRSRASFIANDARIIDGAIDQSAIQNNMDGSVPVDAKQFRFAQNAPAGREADRESERSPSTSAYAGTDVRVLTPDIINQPIFSTRRGATVEPTFDGFINYGSPIPTVSGNAIGLSAGPTTTAGETLAVNGTVGKSTSTISIHGLPDLELLNGRRLSDSDGTVATNNRFVAAPHAFQNDADFYRVGSGKKGEEIAGPRYAEAGVMTPSPAATPAGATTVDPALAQAPETKASERVVIVGSNIPTSEEVGTAPVDTVDQAARDRTGAEDVRKPTSEEVAAAPVDTIDRAADSRAPQDVRKLIRNASAELEVASFDATVDAVTANATRAGGFLDTRNSERGGNGKVSGSLVVKVLPEHLDRFLASLRALGDVKNQTVQTEDVTKGYFDTDARLRNSRRMEERLLKMLNEVKGKMTEVLQVEKEIARVRADIETMQGQLKLYDAQVRYATVTLELHERDLNQPAAFLLRETATLSLLAADVEKTADETRRIADAAHAQIVRSEVTRDPSGKSRATLRLLVAPEKSADVIAQIKALGRVENFHVQDERVAQNGTSSDAAAQDPAKVERAPVTLDLTISHDEQISRQVTLTLVAGDVEGAFEKARTAAVAAGGEIVESNVTHPSEGHASAVLSVRVPSASAAGLLASFQSLGRAGEAETRRVGNGPEADAGPVLMRLSVVDAEPAVQQTIVRVETTGVERRAADIKREAAASHAVVEESNFTSESDERQSAGLRFRLPMSAYPEFVERVRALGTVKSFNVQRSERPSAQHRGGNAEANAPVIVDLLLYSEGRIVSEESGLGATFRRTFGQGVGALMWSVRMIGVAVAFIAPWAVLLALGIGAVVWWRKRSEGRAASPRQS